jgi:hypothetical protein
MSDRIFATPESQKTALRQLKILVVILIVSNIGLGLFGIYVLRSVDRKYSALIHQTVPPINELQTLTAWSVDAMRSTNPSLFQPSPNGSSRPVQQAQNMIERDRELRTRALQREWLGLKPGERQDLLEAGDAFTRESLEVLHLFETGHNAEAGQRRETVLRPAFDRYVASMTKTADVLEAESLRTSGRLTEQTGSISHIVLGLASWPFMIVGLFFLAVIIFVLGVLVRVTLFRGAEA